MKTAELKTVVGEVLNELSLGSKIKNKVKNRQFQVTRDRPPDWVQTVPAESPTDALEKANTNYPEYPAMISGVKEIPLNARGTEKTKDKTKDALEAHIEALEREFEKNTDEYRNRMRTLFRQYHHLTEGQKSRVKKLQEFTFPEDKTFVNEKETPMNFTPKDIEAMRHDAEFWGSIYFTPEQIAGILKKNPTLAKKIWDDFESVGHPQGKSMDTEVRDIWFNVIANAYTGQNWPIGADGEEKAVKFFRKLALGLDKAGVKHEQGFLEEEKLPMEETTPPHFPAKIKDKILKQYGETPKAYATMWALHKKMDEGDQRVKEMWMAFEGSNANENLQENWNKPDAVHPSKKGMFKGKTKADLKSRLEKLKKNGRHKRGSEADTKEKELNFALRAKSGWGKVDEVSPPHFPSKISKSLEKQYGKDSPKTYATKWALRDKGVAQEMINDQEEFLDEPEDREPEVDDTVHCCPDCERPNQFGELCPSCKAERDAEDHANSDEWKRELDAIEREEDQEINRVQGQQQQGLKENAAGGLHVDDQVIVTKHGDYARDWEGIAVNVHPDKIGIIGVNPQTGYYDNEDYHEVEPQFVKVVKPAVKMSLKEGIGDWAGWGKETPAQTASQAKLEKAGFTMTHHFPADHQDDPEEKMVIVMSRRKGPRNCIGEIEPDGSVSGKTVDEFIAFANSYLTEEVGGVGAKPNVYSIAFKSDFRSDAGNKVSAHKIEEFPGVSKETLAKEIDDWLNAPFGLQATKKNKWTWHLVPGTLQIFSEKPNSSHIEKPIVEKEMFEHDETDMSDPEEKKEVDIGNEMVGLANQLLQMHRPKGK